MLRPGVTRGTPAPHVPCPRDRDPRADAIRPPEATPSPAVRADAPADPLPRGGEANRVASRRSRWLPWALSAIATALAGVAGGLGQGGVPEASAGGTLQAASAYSGVRFPEEERSPEPRAEPGGVPRVEPDLPDRPAPDDHPVPLVGPEPPWARYGDFRGPPDAELALYAVNLRELVRVQPFRPDGRPDPLAMGQLARVMRCRRSDRQRPIDPRLVVLLSDLYERFDRQTLQLVSGFRVPGEGHTSPTSFHVQGMAADIRLPGMGPGRLYRFAERLGAGGVGLYPRRGDRFVHVDVRDTPYRWRQRWNGRNASRRVRFRDAHETRQDTWHLPPY